MLTKGNRMFGMRFFTYSVLAAMFGGFGAVSYYFGISCGISVFSGGVSILMFLIYVFGRMWLISHNRAICRDKIYVADFGVDDRDRMPADMYISDEIDCLTNGIGEGFVVTSVDGIYDLHINRLLYADDDIVVTGREKAEDINAVDFVNPGHSVYICADSADAFAFYEVEFLTYDYKMVRAPLLSSCRDGSFAGGIEVELTWQSFLYQFLN